jgi:hypothetical protein
MKSDSRSRTRVRGRNSDTIGIRILFVREGDRGLTVKSGRETEDCNLLRVLLELIFCSLEALQRVESEPHPYSFAL